MPRTSLTWSVCLLSLCLAWGAARAGEATSTATPASPYPVIDLPAAHSGQPQTNAHPPFNAPRLHPEACASLCRFFEFLGALERPTPSKPVPTS